MIKKRKDYIDWDTYFMGIAEFSGQRSKDPNTQVGACIVSEDKRILSLGYNGAPNGYDDEDVPWEREGNLKDIKYSYLCHAELNAILNNRGTNLAGSKLYVSLFPCNECAKAIIQTGIKEVIYMSDKYDGTDANIVSKRLLDSCGVTYKQYEKKGHKIEIDL